jgi:F-type H+-transporting ATPase subunit delta
MADIRVASRYVRSLLGLAESQNALDHVHQDMLLIDKACDTNREFLIMLRSPVIKHDKKRDILEKVFKGKVHPLTMAIMDILTRKNREPLLPAIANEFHNAYNEFKGIGKATITTPVPLDAKLRAEIETLVKKISTRKEVELKEKVDKELIGGFLLQVNDKQIDASIASQLAAMRLKFKENPYVKDF